MLRNPIGVKVNSPHGRFRSTSDYERIFWILDPSYGQEKLIGEDVLVPVFSLFGIIVNLFVLIVCFTSSNMMRLRTSYLIISLCVADLLVCGMVMPLTSVTRGLQAQKDKVGFINKCSAWLFFVTLTCTASSFNICAITIDRYLFITSPLHYEQKMTKTRIGILLFIVWTSSVIIAVITPVIHDSELEKHKSAIDSEKNKSCLISPQPNYAFLVAIIVLFVPMSVIIILYVKIYRVIKTHRKIMRRHMSVGRIRLKDVNLFEGMSNIDTRKSVTFEQSSDGQETESIPSSMVTTSSRISRARRLFSLRLSSSESVQNSIAAQDRKSWLVLCIVVGTYMICWIPYAVYIILTFFLRREFSYKVREILLMFGYSNSCWNPMIYAGLNQVFRSTANQVCTRITRCRRSIDSSNMQP